MNADTSPPLFDDLDQLRTFKGAAAALRIPYFKIQRAARAGIIPTYSLLNKRSPGQRPPAAAAVRGRPGRRNGMWRRRNGQKSS